MTIRDDARQEAERRWPEWLQAVKRDWLRAAFLDGAVWAREQDTQEPSDADLIRRLHEVIDTALSDSLTVENDRAAGRAEIEAIEAERREAETVRDEVAAALRRLAHLIEWVEENRPIRCSMYSEVGDDSGTILRIARGETTSHEDRRDP